MLILLALLMFQDTNHANDHQGHAHSQEEGASNHQGHTHSKGDDFVYFEHLSPGTIVELKNFIISIPEGLFYANEENVPYMLPLTGATSIPNCVGIFYSNSNNWTYSAVVQLFPDLQVTLEPEIEAERFVDFFKNNHLYKNSPFNGQADVVIPPTYQREENSFTLGMQYTEEDHTLVIIKKVFATEHGALVISYKGNDEAFKSEPEAPDKIMSSVAIAADYPGSVDSSQAPISYLQLLGFNPQMTLLDAAAGEEGLDPGVLAMSILLGLSGIALLIFALRLRGKKPAPQTV